MFFSFLGLVLVTCAKTAASVETPEAWMHTALATLEDTSNGQSPRRINTLDVADLHFDSGIPGSVVGEARSLWQREPPERPSQNISDFYRGYWHGLNETRLEEIDGLSPNPLLNGSLGIGPPIGGATSYQLTAHRIEFPGGKIPGLPFSPQKTNADNGVGGGVVGGGSSATGSGSSPGAPSSDAESLLSRPFGDTHYLTGRAVIRGTGPTGRATALWMEGAYSPQTGRVFAVLYPRGTFPHAADFTTTGRYGHGAKGGTGGVTVTKTDDGVLVVGNSGRGNGSSGGGTGVGDEHVELVRRMRVAHYLSRGVPPPSLWSFGHREDSQVGVLPKQYCLLKMYGVVELRRRYDNGTGPSSAGPIDAGIGAVYEGIDYSRMMFPEDRDGTSSSSSSSSSGGDSLGYEPREPGLMNMTSVVFSPDCHTAIATDATALEIAAYYAKVSNYVAMVVVVSVAQVYVLIRQAESVTTQTGAARLSLYSVGMMALIDAYLCLFQLSGGVLVPFAFSSFITAVFLKFVIFSVFEMRIMINIWKSRRRPGDPDALYFVLLFSRFYLVLAFGFLLLFWLQDFFPLLLLSLYSFWVPQIVHNVVNNVRRPHETRFVWVMTLSRLAIPLYFSGCPRNFLGFGVSPTLPIVLSAWVIAQGALLHLQGIRGPRFFVPRALVPVSYDYRRIPMRDLDEMERGTDGEGTDCVICMMPVTDEHTTAGSTMLTPCGHLFHGDCLERWMEIKLECPTCRSPLPPI